MRMPRRFGTAHAIAHREATVITAMMDDLRRIVEILDFDVASEEERAHVFDRSDALYPILARTLAARRDNLKLTVAALGQRLRDIDAAAAQVVATAA
jgi:hypothetical protein